MKRISDKNKPFQRADVGISVWQQKNTYSVDDIVYDALHNHIVKRTSTNPAEATETTPPSESNRWTLVNSIPVWAANIQYPLNFILEQDGILYKCNSAHTSTTFVADSANWTAISAAGGIVPWELTGSFPPSATTFTVYYGTPAINGNVISKSSTGGDGYGHHIAANVTTPLDMSIGGVVVIEGKVNTATYTDGAGQATLVLNTSTDRAVFAGWTGYGWVFGLMQSQVNQFTTSILGAMTDIPAVGVDLATGNAFAYLNGILVIQGPFASGGQAEGWMTGSTLLAAGALSFQSDGAAEIEVVTSVPDFVYNYPVSRDIAGNAGSPASLPPTAVPGSLLEVVVGGVYNGSPYNVGDVVAVLSDGVNVVRLSNSIPSVPSLSSAAGVLTVDLSLSDYYTITLTENITSIVFTNALGGTKPSTKMFEITQGTTPYTVTWPASFLWEGAAPVVSDTANAIDILAITSFNGGTTWHGTLSKGRA